MTVGNALNLAVTGVVTQNGTTGAFTGSAVTQYRVLCGGGSNSVDQVAALGSSGDVLTSNGAGALPTFQTPGGGSGWVLLSTATASSSATLNFTSSINSTYNLYAFVLDEIKPATDNVPLRVRTSTNGGSSYDSGATDYDFKLNPTWGTGETADSAITISGNIGNATNEALDYTLFMYNPSAANYCRFSGYGVGEKDTGTTSGGPAYGSRKSAADVDAVQFFFSSGNIASGTIKMYGCCKP